MTPEQRELEKKRALAKARARRRRAEAESSQQAETDTREVVSMPDTFMGVPFPDMPTVTSSSPDGKYRLEVPDIDAEGAPSPASVQQYIYGVHNSRRDAAQRERLEGIGDDVFRGLANAYTGPVIESVSRNALQSGSSPNLAKERTGAAFAAALDFPSRGFDDEIAGMAFGPDARDTVRANKEAAYAQHPVSALAIQGPLSLADPLNRVKGATMMQRALSGATRGGIQSGLYGLGSGDDDNRLQKAATYGVFGAGIGVTATPALEGVGILARKMAPAELRAFAGKLLQGGNYALNATEIRALDDALAQMQTTAQSNGRRISREQAQRELVDGLRQAEANDFVFEALGEDGMTAAIGVAQRGMAGNQIGRDALAGRAEGQFGRLDETLNKLADGEDVASSLTALQNVKRDQANPLYAQAFRQPVDYVRPEFEQLKRIMGLEDFQGGRAQGERILRNRTRNPQAKFEELPFFKQVQYIKEGVDDKIGAALKSGDTKLAGSLIDAKNEMLRLADTINPTYGQARRIWAGAQAQENAALMGGLVFGSGQQSRLRNLQAAYNKMSEAERTAFAVGLYDEAREIMGRSLANAESNSVSARLINPNVEQKVRALLPNDQAEEFLSTLNREFRQQRTAQQVFPNVGTQTPSRILAADAVRQSTTGALRRAGGAVLGGRDTINNLARRARERLESDPGRQNALAQFLFRRADDPDLQNALRVGSGATQAPPAAPATNALAPKEPVQQGVGGGIGTAVGGVAGAGAGALESPEASATGGISGAVVGGLVGNALSRGRGRARMPGQGAKPQQQPPTYYHGTTGDFDGALRPSQDGLQGPGVYLAKSPDGANFYSQTALGAEGANIRPVQVNGEIAPPQLYKQLFDQFSDQPNTNELIRQELQRRGYVGAAHHVEDQVVIYDPAAVRSQFASTPPAQPRMTSAGGTYTVKSPAGNVPVRIFDDSQSGAKVFSPEWPNSALDDAVDRIDEARGLGPGPWGKQPNPADYQDAVVNDFVKFAKDNPGESVVLPLFDGVDAKRVADQLAASRIDWITSDRMLVVSADGGDMAIVNKALTGRNGPYQLEPATRGDRVNWFRVYGGDDLDRMRYSRNNAATGGTPPAQSGLPPIVSNGIPPDDVIGTSISNALRNLGARGNARGGANQGNVRNAARGENLDFGISAQEKADAALYKSLSDTGLSDQAIRQQMARLSPEERLALAGQDAQGSQAAAQSGPSPLEGANGITHGSNSDYRGDIGLPAKLMMGGGAAGGGAYIYNEMQKQNEFNARQSDRRNALADSMGRHIADRHSRHPEGPEVAALLDEIAKIESRLPNITHPGHKSSEQMRMNRLLRELEAIRAAQRPPPPSVKPQNAMQLLLTQ
jgi:hypothetical protein